MNKLSANTEYRPLETYMEIAGNPTFLLSCLGPQVYVLEKLGRQHAKETGLDPALCEGKMPHDFLPERMADTVVANYETCRRSGQPFSYTEVLELPTGKRWWRTTLTPVRDASGTIGMIFGSATDITDMVERSHHETQRQAEQHAVNERLKVFASMSAKGAQGPLQTVLGLLDFIKDGFLDLGDEKLDQLVLCETIVRDALGSMDGVLDDLMKLSTGAQDYSQFDLGHVCRDTIALVDPDGRFEISYPERDIWANNSVVQLVLAHVLQNAMKYASQHVAITCETGPDGTVSFTVCDDGMGLSHDIRCDGSAVVPKGQTEAKGPVHEAWKLLAGCGGKMFQPSADTPLPSAVSFTLPGRIMTS